MRTEATQASPDRPWYSRRATRGLVSFVRSNQLFVALLVLGIIVRVLVWLAYQPALMLQRDAYSYLALAFDPEPQGYRPVSYAFVLRGLLSIGDLSFVSAAQHAMGLMSGALIYFGLRRVGVSAAIAAIGTIPVLLDGFQLDLEQYLLAEAFFELLIVGGAVLLVWREVPAAWQAALAGMLLGLATITRFAGAPLLAVALLYMLVRRAGWRRTMLLALAFFVSVAGYSLWFRSTSGTLGPTNRNGFALYGRIASFAECSGLEIDADLRRFCISKPRSERMERYGWFIANKTILRVPYDPALNQPLSEFSRKVILNQPTDYLYAVGNDFLEFVRWVNYEAETEVPSKWRFISSLSEAKVQRTVRRFGGSAQPELGFDEPFTINRDLVRFLSPYQKYVHTQGPILGMMLILGALSMIVPGRTSEAKRLRSAGLLFELSALAIMLFPMLTTVYHFRYGIPPKVLAGPAAACGLQVLLSWFHRKRATSPTTDGQTTATEDSVSSQPRASRWSLFRSRTSRGRFRQTKPVES